MDKYFKRSFIGYIRKEELTLLKWTNCLGRLHTPLATATKKKSKNDIKIRLTYEIL